MAGAGSAAALLAEVHGALLRELCNALQSDCCGLAVAARMAKSRSLIPPKLCKTLVRLDEAWAFVRHVNSVKCAHICTALADALAGASGAELAGQHAEQRCVEPQHECEAEGVQVLVGAGQERVDLPAVPPWPFATDAKGQHSVEQLASELAQEADEMVKMAAEDQLSILLAKESAREADERVKMAAEDQLSILLAKESAHEADEMVKMTAEDQLSMLAAQAFAREAEETAKMAVEDQMGKLLATQLANAAVETRRVEATAAAAQVADVQALQNTGTVEGGTLPALPGERSGG